MSPDINFEDLLSCAVTAVCSAGDHALRNIHKRIEITETFAHDVKLKLDSECQACAESVIRSHFPEHVILGEEDIEEEVSPPHPDREAYWRCGKPRIEERKEPRSNDGSEYQWIIDPIDGTVNFSHGLPLWCCSIAVRYHEDIVAGVVYAPVLNELYTATTDQPSLLNDSTIQVSTVETLSKAIVLTGLDKDIDSALPPFAIFEKIASNTQKARIMGSAALDICQVACGRADGYFESGIFIWDVAAAGLIVRQAKGKAEILTHQDNNRLQFLATNGRIHAALKTLAHTSHRP